jgi:hypothetical protein
MLGFCDLLLLHLKAQKGQKTLQDPVLGKTQPLKLKELNAYCTWKGNTTPHRKMDKP